MSEEQEQYYMPPYQQPPNDFVRVQFGTIDEYIDDIQHSLRNEALINGIWKKNPNSKLNINSIGINQFTALLRNILHPVHQLGKMDENRINKTILYAKWNFHDVLRANFHNWGLDFQSVVFLTNIYNMNVSSIYYRNIDGLAFKGNTVMTQRIEQHQTQDASQQKKRSILNPLRLLGGGK